MSSVVVQLSANWGATCRVMKYRPTLGIEYDIKPQRCRTEQWTGVFGATYNTYFVLVGIVVARVTQALREAPTEEEKRCLKWPNLKLVTPKSFKEPSLLKEIASTETKLAQLDKTSFRVDQ